MLITLVKAKKNMMEFFNSLKKDGKIDAQHTIVRPAMEGQGLAGELVKRLIADARAEGKKLSLLVHT